MSIGRYSPVPGSNIDIQYQDDRKSRLFKAGTERSTLQSFTQFVKRKWKIFASASFLALVLFFLLRPRTSRQELGHINYDAVDWSSFAYSQYATDESYLCNTVMVFESLQRLGSRADRILFYPETWDLDVSDRFDRISQLLVLARDVYKVKLMPVDIPDASKIPAGQKLGDQTWGQSAAKLFAFGEIQYQRILHIDSDVTIYKHLDELFLLPSAPVAMPRAYWTDQKPTPLTSLLVLLEPSTAEFAALVNASRSVAAGTHKYDMEMLNDRYHESALVLPSRPFLITGELRNTNHEAYLGKGYKKWDVNQVLADVSLVHFSDFPLPKPWVMWPLDALKAMRPDCRSNPGTARESDCADRQAWMHIYDEFRRRRKEICKLLSVPAPKWPPKGLNITSLQM